MLPAHQFIDALGQRAPMQRGQIEVAAQMEQRGLLDGAAHPSAVHQTVGDIGLARDAVAGLGAANEQASEKARKIELAVTNIKILWHYISL